MLFPVNVTENSSLNYWPSCSLLSGAFSLTRMYKVGVPMGSPTVTGMRGHEWQAGTSRHRTSSDLHTESQRSPWPTVHSRKTLHGIPERQLHSLCLTLSWERTSLRDSLCYQPVTKARKKQHMAIFYFLGILRGPGQPWDSSRPGCVNLRMCSGLKCRY